MGVKEIQSTVTTRSQKKVMESLLFRRLSNIARVAPDMLDVVVRLWQIQFLESGML